MAISSKKAECHPDKRHVAHGLCQNCYDKWRYRNQPARRDYQIKRSRARKGEENRIRTLKKYGISIAEYQQLLDKQGGVCAICAFPEPREGYELAVDHNHTTGKVRGLLCMYCNTALGGFFDNRTYLRHAIEYLDSNG